MNLITVYCTKCKTTGKEHAFAPEHFDEEKRTCPEPVWDAVMKKWKTCGGKLSIKLKYRGKFTWSKVMGVA